MASVLILGGGVAGMSAAHELVERGFDVVVLEKNRIPGGKARSIPVAGGAEDGLREAMHFHEAAPGAKPWVPGEHGFRFFPGFYKHVVDSMQRTPMPAGGTVADQLVPTTRIGITQYDQPMFTLPARFPRSPGDAVTVLGDVLIAFSSVTGLEPEDLAHFGARIWQILTSCPERRLAEYEKTSWWGFIGAEDRSSAYKKFLASGITRSLVAAKAETASTRTIGDIFVQLILTMLDPSAATTDRVLDGPTNRVWIEPWHEYLVSMGVDYRTETEVASIEFDGRRVTGVTGMRDGTSESFRADYYVCALPIERTAPLLPPQLTAADEQLRWLIPLSANVQWMNGLMFYLRREIPILHGHLIHIDTQWALTSISQIQFWKPDTLSQFGDPEVQGILSIDISDWEAPGLNGRIAAECTRDEVMAETWEQLKRSLNAEGAEVISDDDLVGWFIDPDIQPNPDEPGRLRNMEPLLVNLVDSWRMRPEATTQIPNLFLASDYVRTYTDLATMEAANEAARRAVNGILDDLGDTSPRCELWPLQEPAALEAWRSYDRARFEQGLPWDGSLVETAASALTAAAPALDHVSDLLGGVDPFVPVINQVSQAVDESEPVAMAEADLTEVGRLSQGAGSPLLVDVSLPISSTAQGAGAAAGQRSSATQRTPSPGPAGFGDRLEWFRTATIEAITGMMPTGEPRRHLYDLIDEFVRRPSKGLRPGLLLATTGMYGGNVEDALPSAAGVELLHSAFLVHDDIEDESLSRRGSPTMHRQVGVPLAVNTGDAMNAHSLRMFRSNVRQLGPEAALRIFDEVDHMLIQSLEGQAMELGWVRDNNVAVKPADYFNLVLKKTGWYSFIHPLRIGALIANPQDRDLGRFNRFGALLGAAFQIQDDVLNLEGTRSAYGKEIAGDLWEGKRSLVMVHSLSNATASQRSRLESFLARPRSRRLPREIHEYHELLHECGSVAWARSVAEALTNAAREQMSTAFAGAEPGPDLAFIESLVDYVPQRIR